MTGNVNLLTVGFTCLLYAILSLGLNIAVGWAGLLDLGYIAFVGFGAYGYAIFSSTALGYRRRRAAAHLAGVRLDPDRDDRRRPGRRADRAVALRLEGDYLAIVTLFVGQAFVEIVNNVDPGTLGGVNGLFGLDSLHGLSGNVSTPRGYYFVALIVVAVLAWLLHLLDTSRTGRAWRALRDDPLAASAMTIPVNKLKVMAFSFSAAIGALGGRAVRRPAVERVPDELHREHPDPDLRVPRARRRREHRRGDRRRHHRLGARADALEPDRRRRTCSTA